MQAANHGCARHRPGHTGLGIEHLKPQTGSFFKCGAVWKQSVTDEYFSVRQKHGLGGITWVYEIADFSPARRSVGKVDHFDSRRDLAGGISSGEHEPFVRHRLSILVNLDEAGRRAAVWPDFRGLIQKPPVVFG